MTRTEAPREVTTPGGHTLGVHTTVRSMANATGIIGWTLTLGDVPASFKRPREPGLQDQYKDPRGGSPLPVPLQETAVSLV